MISFPGIGRRIRDSAFSSAWVQRLVASALVVGLLGLRIIDPEPVEILRLKVFDLFQQISPRPIAESPVVIVDIDEASLAEIGQWPWPRTQIAQMIVNLMGAGAVAIGFDVVFAERDRLSPDLFAATAYDLPWEIRDRLSRMTSNDDRLAAVLAETPVVLGQSANPATVPAREEPPPPVATIAEFNGDPRPFLIGFRSSVRNIPVLEEAAQGLGMFTLRPDQDSVVRRVPGVLRIGETIYPTLSLELLRVAVGEHHIAVHRDLYGGGIERLTVAGLAVPTDLFGRIWVRYAPHDPDLYLSAAPVVEGTFDRERVRGRLVLIGASAEGLKDIRATALGVAMPGVEVHAQLLQTILANQVLIRPNYAIGLELFVTFVSGLAMVILLPSLGARWTLPVYLVIASALLFGSWYLFTQELFAVDAAYPVLSALLVFIALVYANYARVESQKTEIESQRRQIRLAFSQYISPALVEELVNHPDRLRLGGESKEITIMFCDVQGFTRLAEVYKSRPQDLTRMINELLTPLTDIILEHGGTIDKFMGDAIMAFWNAPLDIENHAERACHAALAMQRDMKSRNQKDRRQFDASQSRETEDREFIDLKIGIGINTGTVVIGNMGSRQRFDYSVLGDPVNLASRLEGQTRVYGVDAVIGPATMAQAGGRLAVLELDMIAVKGKSEAERVYVIAGDESVAKNPEFLQLSRNHAAMLAAYRRQDWNRAERLVEACRDLAGDGLTGIYAEYARRIAGYRLQPPAPDWGGIHVATLKK